MSFFTNRIWKIQVPVYRALFAAEELKMYPTLTLPIGSLNEIFIILKEYDLSQYVITVRSYELDQNKRYELLFKGADPYSPLSTLANVISQRRWRFYPMTDENGEWGLHGFIKNRVIQLYRGLWKVLILEDDQYITHFYIQFMDGEEDKHEIEFIDVAFAIE